MRIQSFIIAYALVLAILLFADRRPGSNPPDRYSHVVDLTEGQSATPHSVVTVSAASESAVSESLGSESLVSESLVSESKTRIIAPAALIPGTWAAGQIPAERLVAPLVVIDLKDLKTVASPDGETRQSLSQISLDDIAAWESLHGMIPPGAVIAIRRAIASAALPHSDLSTNFSASTSSLLPVTRDAALFLIEARNTIGFAVETPVTLSSDRNLAQQLALHGTYVVQGAAHFSSLPATGSLVIVAPAKDKKAGEAQVRVLAMVR